LVSKDTASKGLVRIASIFLIASISFTAVAFSASASWADDVGRNRLANEKSPYLLKHATNPVDWYPWGEEAFERARKGGKPIFLSIGYLTCHWCSVMEEESFSDPEVAALMNEAFVSIKVDREERPDIDGVYMRFCLMVSENCGWPLTILMTPEKKPFFVGTYLPKETRFGRMGLMELIPRVKALWQDEREKITQSAELITGKLAEASISAPGEGLDASVLVAAYDTLAGSFDPENGGFGRGNKFPTPTRLFFLLRYWKRTGDEAALDMVVKTLTAMRQGGIYDHLGFGFHRYATDSRWLVPHFEKMLYDQALIAMVYTEAYQATGREEFARTAKEVFTYVLRDMASPEGGFHSAQGADSDGEEGKFYLWREEEVREVLGKEEAERAIKAFNIEPGGNFVDILTGKKTGENVLHVNGTVDTEGLEGIRKRLYEVREGRVHPEKDDKVLTSWNGLMVAALARAARVLEEPGYARAAQRAADFVLREMKDGRGRLLHRWRGGPAAITANAEDYAFLIWGLIELYQWGYEERYLEEAMGLTGEFVKYYWDDEGGGFYFTPTYGERILVRLKEVKDDPVPSANSAAMLDLLRLSRLTGRPEFEKRAAELSEAFSGEVREHPSSYAMHLCAFDLSMGPSFEVVIVGRRGAEDTGEMLRALGRAYLPSAVVLFRPAGEEAAAIIRLAPFVKDMSVRKKRATAYVCTNFLCREPTNSVDEMLKALGVRAGP
jgi:uncharacterized protein YyaL (SSP411 family)